MPDTTGNITKKSKLFQLGVDGSMAVTKLQVPRTDADPANILKLVRALRASDRVKPSVKKIMSRLSDPLGNIDANRAIEFG